MRKLNESQLQRESDTNITHKKKIYMSNKRIHVFTTKKRMASLSVASTQCNKQDPKNDLDIVHKKTSIKLHKS